MAAPIGIALLDRDGAIAGANPAMCALFGCLPEALLEVSLTGLVHGDDAAAVRALLDASVLRPRTAERLEVRCLRADRTLRWGELSVSDVEDSDDDHWTVAQVQDVQHRHETDLRLRRIEERNAGLADELQRRNAELHDTNQRLRRFASLASHDLSAPLASISGVLAHLQRRSGDLLEPQDRELLEAGRERAESMRGLVRDMLEYARGAMTLQLDDVELGAVVAEALAALGQDAAGREPRVHVGPLPTVRGDRAQLLRLLRNLLSNAVKFVEPGVRPELHVDARRRAFGWEVGVTDNGPGVAEADRERIFDMLERAHPRSVSGSGLGLAICAEVVARHGGEIWVQPGSHGGSRFAFSLPDDPRAAGPAEDPGVES
jgi:chemotaxis family two-component system sensor kinase Cph1